MRTRLLLSLPLLSLAAFGSADTWNLANDFSFTSNPNGVWTYGALTSTGFHPDLSHSTPSVTVFQGWTYDGNTNLWKNVTTSTQFGTNPGEVALQSYNYLSAIADARWTAPYDGNFSFDVIFNALTDHNLDYGLNLDGVAQTPSSNGGGMITYGFNNVSLRAGETLDAYSSYSSDRELDFTVVGQPTPEPASLAVLGVGALAVLLRRRKA